jgi:hypothetical protein
MRSRPPMFRRANARSSRKSCATRINHLHTELARRYAGKPQPEGERETEAIEQAIALWQALWEQYSTLLKPLIEGDAELQGVKAKVLQRGLFVRQAVDRRPRSRPARDTGYRMARAARLITDLPKCSDCAVTAVTDEQMPYGVGTSCYFDL